MKKRTARPERDRNSKGKVVAEERCVFEHQLANLKQLDGTIEAILDAARIPGAAIAVVANGETVFANGYGFRDEAQDKPMQADTVYPIASTSKAFNATLIGMLVDEGLLGWDTPARDIFPGFRLQDPVATAQATLRDLLCMRTGLPRHDYVWSAQGEVERADIARRMAFLEPSAGFREKFQYNNLTCTYAGYIAEVVTGKSWEDLVRERILKPLGMTSTGYSLPEHDNTTVGWHENVERKLVACERLPCEVTAPSGGAIHSTVEDMARWLAFNLNQGAVNERQLIKEETLAEIHAPNIATRSDGSSPTPHSAYAMGWFVDSYNGIVRVAHGGYLYDVSSEAALFPEAGIGVVAFVNFGPSARARVARLLTQAALECVLGLEPKERVEDRITEYETLITDNTEKLAAVRRIDNAQPSHRLQDYAGDYTHPGYGSLTIETNGNELTLRRSALEVSLVHWHYDAWVGAADDRWAIHGPHPFDTANPVLFETGADGDVAAIAVQFEPSLAPIRFAREV